MGIFAQTDFTIECKDEKSAKAVFKKLKSLKEDANGNTFGRDLELLPDSVLGKESSGRIQNLEFRMDAIWEAIKDIKGVISLDAPFMSEADGIYRSNEE